MCEINWQLLLEYFKVLFGWPPIALVIAGIFFSRFHAPIKNFLNRATEANVLGQTVKAAPPLEQQRDLKIEDPLVLAAEAKSAQAGAAQAPESTQLPPDLQNDPQAQLAINYVKSNPIQTVVEFKRLLFNFNCERVFNAIYGTQIALLEFLAARSNDPATLPELSPFHTSHQTLIGNTEYQLRDYVRFLLIFGLISAEGPPDSLSYRITQAGVEFLSYIKATYPSAWSNRAF